MKKELHLFIPVSLSSQKFISGKAGATIFNILRRLDDIVGVGIS